nr:hypothetical protein [Brucella anthropi]DAM62865.1 MAG TPA: hypothetical protein [Caudoviricetes sp.]
MANSITTPRPVDDPEHPRRENEPRDEIEMFIRDAYAAGCAAARNPGGALVAFEYAAIHAPKLRARLTPSPAHAATDTGLVTGLWLRPIGPHAYATTKDRSTADDWEKYVKVEEYVTRSQAEELLAAKDAAIKRWRSECESAQSQNVELAEQLAKAEADVSRWHQKAMDAGVITHSDGTTSHPMRKERDDLKADNAEKDREIGQLKAALGADAAQFMQSLVDECSREIEKRKALEAKLAAVERALTLPDAERRLFFISELLAKRGYFNRADLCSTFGISVPQASIDIRKWMAANNGEAFYNKATKRYEGGDCAASEDAK